MDELNYHKLGQSSGKLQLPSNLLCHMKPSSFHNSSISLLQNGLPEVKMFGLAFLIHYVTRKRSFIFRQYGPSIILSCLVVINLLANGILQPQVGSDCLQVGW